MKYLPIIIVAVIIIIAVIIIMSIAKSKKSNKEDTTTTKNSGDFIVPADKENENDNEIDTTPVTFMEDVEISFEGISSDLADMLTEHELNSSSAVAIKPEIKTTQNVKPKPEKPKKPQITTKEHLEATTVVTNENAVISKKVTDVITSFSNRIYYFDGEMISDGEKTPLEIAMNKSDFQVFTEMEDKDISFMFLESKIYMLNPDTKKYTEFSASLQKMMGVDASQFSFEFNNAKFNGDNPDSVTKALYNGQDAICYTYKNEDAQMDFICVNDEIKQMTLFDTDGTAKTVLVADEFISEIPDDMLNFKGYSKTNIISFMSSLM